MSKVTPETNPGGGGGLGPDWGGGNYGGDGSGTTPSTTPSGGVPIGATVTYELYIEYNGDGAPSPSIDTIKSELAPGTVNKVTIKYNENAINAPSTYYFRQWTRNVNGTVTYYKPGQEVTKTWVGDRFGTESWSGDTGLYPDWVQSGLYVFMPDSHAKEKYYQSITKSSGVSAQLKDAVFTRTGYIQVGWSITEDGEKAYDLGQTLTPDDNNILILYPVWEHIPYKVTLHSNRDPDQTVELTAYYGEDILIPDDTFSKSGYRLSVWNENAEGTSSSWVAGETYTYMRDEDVNLYAVWEGEEYTVSYYDGDTLIHTSKAVYGSPFYTDRLSYPEDRVFNSFDGWKADSSFLLGMNDVSNVANGSNKKLSVSDNLITVSATGAVSSSAVVIHDAISSALINETLSEGTYDLDISDFSTTINGASKSGLIVNITDGENALTVSPGDTFTVSDGAVISSVAYSTSLNWSSGATMQFRFRLFKDLVKSDAWFDAYSYGSDPTWPLQRNLSIYRKWSPYLSFGKIFFGGEYSDDCGIKIEEPPSYTWPGYSYDHQKVYGKNGDILRDNERYENVDKKYKISAYDGLNFASVSRKVSEWLHRKSYRKYMRLEDSYEQDVYRLAVYEESNELENILAKAGKCDIVFNCKPQKYLITGDTPIDILQSGQVIVNPTPHASFPIIKLYGVGTLYVNGVEIEISQNFNYIVFDAESVDAVSAGGGNMNGYVTVLDPVVLYPGANIITYEGELFDISVTPRWWRI